MFGERSDCSEMLLLLESISAYNNEEHDLPYDAMPAHTVIYQQRPARDLFREHMRAH